MLTLKSLVHPSIPSVPRPFSPLYSTNSFHPLIPLVKTQLNIGKSQSRLVLLAHNDDNNGIRKEPSGTEQQEKENNPVNNNGNGDGGDNDTEKDGRPLFNLRWVELFVDPDPDNILAVGLTGLLTWASVQVLWQLFIVSLAILVAALKYSSIAALLIFILITLL
ncbi:hypothetical protein K2173_020579 [Erythroxylum novogranatense]|uniref:Transmembrane protein n=1 Tax=Erythroxylum novogranatense TaxID=1862640 RepID=A0AAV8TH38_9ROSI|nr:hypothetical protein K2173_020579 [Erythroxylum novogranatense]